MAIPSVIGVILALLFLFIIFYRIETKNHQKNLKSIPIRILVNGSRGKSSVTRMIAAGLRVNGKKVIAKTTGTSARFILSNIEEEPVIRLGMATIREQIRIIKKAAKKNPDAIVLECMALHPELQWTESVQIVKPTAVVITNVRADHLDVMGPTIKDIAQTFISVVPKNCKVFTAESHIFDVFAKPIRNKNIEIFASKTENVLDTTIKKFSYVEHKENVALALDICKYLGLDEKVALEGMYTATPDPGVTRIYTINLDTKKITIINALAANDPESIYQIWQSVDKNFPEINLLINCRKDRINRSLQLANLIKKHLKVDHYILTGSGTAVLARNMRKIVDKNNIFNFEGKKPEQVFDKVSKFVANKSLLFAIGNAVSHGEKIIEYFLKKGRHDVT